MKKLEKYSSFDELKANSTSGTVTAAERSDRQGKFESLIHFLRGDSGGKHSSSKTKISKVR